VKDESEVDLPFEKIDALIGDDGLEVLCTAISRANGGPPVRLRPALIGPDDGPWIYAVPSEVTRVLAGLDRFEVAAEFWLAEEEGDLAPKARTKTTRPEQIRELAEQLREFSSFARAAVEARQEVYLCIW